MQGELYCGSRFLSLENFLSLLVLLLLPSNLIQHRIERMKIDMEHRSLGGNAGFFACRKWCYVLGRHCWTEKCSCHNCLVILLRFVGKKFLDFRNLQMVIYFMFRYRRMVIVEPKNGMVRMVVKLMQSRTVRNRKASNWRLVRLLFLLLFMEANNSYRTRDLSISFYYGIVSYYHTILLIHLKTIKYICPLFGCKLLTNMNQLYFWRRLPLNLLEKNS